MQDTVASTRRRGFSEFRAELQSQIEELKLMNARMDAREAKRERLEEETRVLREETEAILASISAGK
jgi:hypothetical protein